jgi:penicillin-binding protein 1B
MDEPTSFQFGKVTYEPGNYGEVFHGTVTMRDALLRSLNVPTVKLAEMVGYNSVVNIARRAGLNRQIHATPAIALGAYETTPLEMAGAYTVFANQGRYVEPVLIAMVRSPDGSVVYEHSPDARRALDPRVAYLTVNMMEDVLRRGTGAGVRSRGFTGPAAGKTGTSRDGWFAGFTSELLCVVWVGFDDNTDLNLEGAQSALPIWAEFMKRAQAYRQYRDAKPFRAPGGITSVEICPESGQRASDLCPNIRTEVFIEGSQPVVHCDAHSLVAPLMEPVPQPVPQSMPASGTFLPVSP